MSVPSSSGLHTHDGWVYPAAAMFVTVELHTIFHAQFIGAFMVNSQQNPDCLENVGASKSHTLWASMACYRDGSDYRQKSLCRGFRRTGKAMGQVYQCWWRMCREINVFPKFQYHMFYLLTDSPSYRVRETTLPELTVLSTSCDTHWKVEIPRELIITDTSCCN
jgi:hypothetical protein